MIKPLGNRIFLLKDKQLEKKGEIILLKKFEYNGEKVLSLRERDITAIIDKKVQIS